MERIFGLAKVILLALSVVCLIIRLIMLVLHRKRTGEKLALKPLGWYSKIEIYSLGGKRRRSTMQRANWLTSTAWVIMTLLIGISLLGLFFKS